MMQQQPFLILATTIAAPIMEEITFRKAIFGGLASRLNRILAAIISSLLFAFFTSGRAFVNLHGHRSFPMLAVPQDRFDFHHNHQPCWDEPDRHFTVSQSLKKSVQTGGYYEQLV